MYGYGRDIPAWCHIIRAGQLVELLARMDVALSESEVSHTMKAYSMVHASKGSFEVGVSHVDVFS